jgi:hypothetical protein
MRYKPTKKDKDGKIQQKGEPWKLLGSTEMQKDNLNPDFAQSVRVPYFFEKHQYVKFVIVDGDSSKVIGKVKT